MKRFKVLLNANFSGPQAWLLLAIRRGYVTEAGVELEFTPGTGAYNAAPGLVARGFDLAYGDLNSLIEVAAAEPERAPTCVHALFNASAAAVAVPVGSEIATPADLKDKHLIGHASDVGLRTFRAFAEATGLDPDAVKVETADGAMAELVARLDSERGPHGLFGYVSTITAALAAQGKDAATQLRWLRYDHHAPFFYGSGFMASPRVIAEEPEVLTRLVGAINRGVAEALADEEAALDAVLSFAPEADREVERIRWRTTLAVELAHPDGERLGLGMIDEARFTESVRRHASALKLPRIPETERLFTARFLPPAAELARTRWTQGADA